MECLNCGYEHNHRDLEVTFEGMGDKPCWRIKYGTLDSIWWGPESALEACAMMMRHWLEWTPSFQEKANFWNQAKYQYK